MEMARSDTRVLPVQFDISGQRFKDFRVAVEEMVERRDKDFPISGPATVIWLLKHMIANGGTPMSFHQRYLSETRLDYSAAGMSEHMTWCKFFEILATYDCLDAGKLASAELGARKVQMIHDRWKHKMPQLTQGQSAGSGGNLEDDSYLLLGTHETRGN
eukprot:4332029-Karenia_brevis.AAC.1